MWHYGITQSATFAMLNLMVPYMGHKKSPKVAHIVKAYGTIKQITIGQQNANRNATHLTYIFKVQRDGIAKVSKFPLIDLETTNTSNSQHGQNSKHLIKDSTLCWDDIYSNQNSVYENEPWIYHYHPMHKRLFLYLHRQLMKVSCNNTNSVVLNLIFKTTQLLKICRKQN